MNTWFEYINTLNKLLFSALFLSKCTFQLVEICPVQAWLSADSPTIQLSADKYVNKQVSCEEMLPDW